jgi:hypothetical protein
VNPVKKVGLCPRLYKELLLSIYNIPGMNVWAFQPGEKRMEENHHERMARTWKGIETFYQS